MAVRKSGHGTADNTTCLGKKNSGKPDHRTSRWNLLHYEIMRFIDLMSYREAVGWWDLVGYWYM